MKKTFILLLIFLLFLLALEFYLKSTSWSKLKIIKKSSTNAVVPSLSPLTYRLSQYRLQKFKTVSGLKIANHKPVPFQSTLENLFPLSGIPKAPTIVCKEEEEFSYISDRYGFNNPDEIWDKPTIDIAFIGDSYVHGYCVQPKNHFIHLLSNTQNILNLGLYGSGPLSELAILLEYASFKKPKVVVWTYMSNDLTMDLIEEQKNKSLLNYLNLQTQSLRTRTSEISEIQKSLLDSQFKKYSEDSTSFLELLNFPHLRANLATFFLKKMRLPLTLNAQNTDYTNKDPINWLLFKQILITANKITSEWGGHLVFLYLPDAGQWVPQHKKSVIALKNKLFQIANKENISVLDYSPILENTQNPLVYYSVYNGQYGHYNKQGQDLLFHFLHSKLNNY